MKPVTMRTADTFRHVEAGERGVEVSGRRLAELQAVLVKMLSDIDATCREHGISYTLGGGSCLGSVRHGGFIPWDDDMDLNMPRADFERFKQLFLADHGDAYYIQDASTPGYLLAFPRIRLKKTTLRVRDDAFLPDEACGVCVDVFLAENVPDSALARRLHGLVSMALGLAYSCRRFAAFSERFLVLVSDDAAATRTFKRKIALGRLLSFWSAEKWTRVWDAWNGRCKDNASTFIAFPVGRGHYFKETYRRDAFFPAADAVFAGVVTCVPRDAPTYLEQLYGSDYMTPPPTGQQETHVVYAFDLGDYADA